VRPGKPYVLVCIHGLPVHFHATILGSSVSARPSVRPALVVTPLYQQPGSDIGFWVLFGLFAVGEGAMRLRSGLNRGGTPSERWSQVIVALAIIGGLLGGLGAASSGSAALITGRWPIFIAGLIFMAAGVYVRQWSIFTLGRFFTAEVRVRADQPVIDTGPYRWVRHPSYTGLIIFFIGLGLALTNAISVLVLAVIPTVGLVVRIHFEERSLMAGLGEPYRQYAATHKRLFPGVW
jgi:protein-S-isoprenylcysteine O-methyltransferase Ste14